MKGFGAKSYEKLSQYVTVDGRTTLAEKVKSPSTRRAKSSRTQQPSTTASK